jgi:hypothetical protein
MPGTDVVDAGLLGAQLHRGEGRRVRCATCSVRQSKDMICARSSMAARWISSTPARAKGCGGPIGRWSGNCRAQSVRGFSRRTS